MENKNAVHGYAHVTKVANSTWTCCVCGYVHSPHTWTAGNVNTATKTFTPSCKECRYYTFTSVNRRWHMCVRHAYDTRIVIVLNSLKIYNDSFCDNLPFEQYITNVIEGLNYPL